jgi:hypothetical protein
LSWDIVDAMSTVKELVPSPDGTAAEPLDAVADEPDEDVDELDEPDELQAAAVRVRIAARPAKPSRGRGLNVPWPCEREGRLYRCIAIATPPFGVGRLVG